MLNGVIFCVRIKTSVIVGLAASEVALVRGVTLPLLPKETPTLLLTHGDQLSVIFFDDFDGIHRAMFALIVLSA